MFEPFSLALGFGHQPVFQLRILAQFSFQSLFSAFSAPRLPCAVFDPSSPFLFSSA